MPALRQPLQQETSPPPGFSHKVKVLMAVAASLVLAILVTMASNDSGEMPEKPEEFNQQEEISGITRREFPAIDLPVNGPIIQVGVFTRLEGAEEKQIALSQLGIESYVHKRTTENGLLYAVLLGPLSAEIHRSTVATLSANNLKYFHRPTRGS